MNSLSIPNQTMSSREIAELTGKRHDNVKRTIDTLAQGGSISHPQIEGGPKSANGVVEKHYLVGKRDSYVIVAQLSPEFTARLVDRWQVLEVGQATLTPANLSRLQLIEMAMQAEQERLVLADKVEAMAPKVEALDRIADAEGLLNPTNAAKALQVPPGKLFTYLRTHEWVYRRAGGRSDVAYQDKIAAGLLTHKVHVARRDDGTERVCEQVMVTPKGLAKLATALETSFAH